MNNKKSKIIQILVLVIFIALIVVLTIEMVPLFKGLVTAEGRIEFKNTIENLGPKGIFALLGLMIAQVLLPVLPGEPVELIAGMCYGTVGGVLIVTLGALISSSLIFFAVRKIGRSFIYTFVSKDKIDNLENSKWFKNPEKTEAIFLVLFLLPGMPKDLLVYVGGLMPVRASRFICISTLARIPAVLMLTTIGGNILDADWSKMIIVFCISTLITGILVYAICKKEKISKEEIK